MKIILNNRVLAGIAGLAGSALLLALFLRDTARTQAAMRQQAPETLARSENPARGTAAVAYVTGAPYRDGLWQGGLARKRGEAAHVSAGRWSSQRDRSAFTDGYLEGFGSPVNEASSPR